MHFARFESAHVERMSRREQSGRVTHEGRPERLARMEVRFRTVVLLPTANKAEDPVKVWAIHTREIAPPEDAKQIEMVPADHRGGDFDRRAH